LQTVAGFRVNWFDSTQSDDRVRQKPRRVVGDRAQVLAHGKSGRRAASLVAVEYRQWRDRLQDLGLFCAVRPVVCIDDAAADYDLHIGASGE
jgi:hypothetical protein